MYYNSLFVLFQMNKDGKIGKIDTSFILKSFYPTAKGDIFKVYPYLMNFHATNSVGHILIFFLTNLMFSLFYKAFFYLFCHAISYEYELFLPILTYKMYVYDTLG